ncbi:hypothetical protein [Crateriforma conspicua]|uniref:hypothetical protein n=1 Tax=Crateriforma conspicua TaxID=2527996 RepID=UPI001E5D2CC5|nr:hypothetical protein [Crateriforma conspicua]
MFNSHLYQTIDGIFFVLSIDNRVVLRAKNDQILVSVDFATWNRLVSTRSVIPLTDDVCHFAKNYIGRLFIAFEIQLPSAARKSASTSRSSPENQLRPWFDCHSLRLAL